MDAVVADGDMGDTVLRAIACTSARLAPPHSALPKMKSAKK
jgi:hypothetical protein